MITSIIRFTEYFNIQFINNDQPWHDNPLSIWIMAEPCIYLISACLLSYRVLFRTVAESRLVSTIYTWINRSSRYSSYNGRHTDRSSKKQSDRKLGDGDSKSEDRLPFTNNASQYATTAGRSETIEPEPTVDGKIHVRQDFGVE